jgi:hypothetical protein
MMNGLAREKQKAAEFLRNETLRVSLSMTGRQIFQVYNPAYGARAVAGQ